MAQSKAQSALLSKYLDLYKKKPTSRVFAPLAEVYRKLGLYDDALKILKEGIKYNPQYVLGYLVLAQCYFDQGKFELTRDTLSPYVTSNRDNITLQRIYAEVCLRLGDLEDALETYKLILFLNPKDNDAIEKVTSLEDKLQIHVQKKLDHPKKTDAKNSLFDEDDDKWVQVDFNSPPELEPNEQENWQMKKSGSTPTFKPDEIKVLERSLDDDFFSSDPDMDSEENEESSQSNPIISHTLVDLYIEQNYFSKAQEILEKILELHPQDIQTMKKLELVKDKMDSTVDEHEELVNLISQKVQAPQNEKLQKAYEEFLHLIQVKAIHEKEKYE